MRRFIQTAYFLPLVTSVIAVSMTWRWIFHTEYGVLNAMLGWIGISPIGWLTTPQWALPSLIMFSIWRSLGYNIVLFWVGLQSIHPQYDKAARVDGVTRWRRFTRVTLPLLAPTLLYVVIISMLHAFKTFDEVYALYGGKAGPMDSAMTVVFYIFRKFYGESEYGIASAAAYVLFVITFGLTMVQLWIFRRKQ
ncbi:carbohydrate ABC transporter permease [Paenibacillus sp. N3.4]|uniref:carbohydrate ABC transporter permease n=1 Tax=Paenibacillus sp. N3.4 TaxID=2603222 RepID=UPI0021C40C0F|nr:sugar ABC transporter permease [Paenibacillus sp. N3.4]